MAQVTAVNISEKKGVRKHEVPYIDVKCHHGIVDRKSTRLNSSHAT